MIRARGFTLVEVLVALAVLAVGLLGAVLMLLGSLRGQEDARREIMATHLLRDAADRIRIGAVDRAWLEARAREIDPRARADIEFLPATGPTMPDRYRVSLRMETARGPGTIEQQVVLFQPPVRAPVAG